MIAFPCPRCGFCLKVPEELAGKTGACAKCRHRVTAPAPASTLPAATADEFYPVDLNTLEIDVEDRVRGLIPMNIGVQGANVNPGALDLPPEPVQVASGLIGTALLVIGLFVPIVNGRSGESVMLLRADHGEGLIVLAMAVVAAVMCSRKRFRWLYIPATVVGAVLAAGYYVHYSHVREIMASLNSDGGIQIVVWGWVVAAIGAIFTFAASALQPKN